jgi:hypothetical protein
VEYHSCARDSAARAENKSIIFEPISSRSAPLIIESETLDSIDAQYTMPDEIGVEDVRLQFVRQLYDESLERHGVHHKETRLLWEYISSFNRPSNVGCEWVSTSKAHALEMARAEQ